MSTPTVLYKKGLYKDLVGISPSSDRVVRVQVITSRDLGQNERNGVQNVRSIPGNCTMLRRQCRQGRARRGRCNCDGRTDGDDQKDGA